MVVVGAIQVGTRRYGRWVEEASGWDESGGGRCVVPAFAFGMKHAHL